MSRRLDSQRTYRVRAHGTVTPEKLEKLATGITVEGVKYQPIKAVLDRETGANNWLTVTLSEGKKREVRRALESLDLMVNRLIRVAYGPFELTDLKPGQVDEIPPDLMQAAIGHLYTASAAPARPATGTRSGAKSGQKPGRKSGSRPGAKPGPGRPGRSAPKSRLGSRAPSGKLPGRKPNKPR